MPVSITAETVEIVLEKIRIAKRPVLYAGNGIRLSGGYDAFRSAVEKLGIPVCTYWDAIDLIETEHPFYVGRGGNMGDRPEISRAKRRFDSGRRQPSADSSRWYNWKTAREAE